MNKEAIIKETEKFVKGKLQGETTGHDWWHVYRVWQTAKNIAKKESGDLFIIELAALLHDIADWKFNDDENAGVKLSRSWLDSLGLEPEIIKKVCHIVEHISFKGAEVSNKIETKEGTIVQDADRLDALGAIGIARCFAYGGSKGNELYNPEVKPTMHKSFEEYKKTHTNSVNHFYEKLLLLKDKMNTETAKKMAEDRHEFMENYLKEFFKEWDGND